MNISEKNVLARFYKWSYGELPQDFCTLFWGSLLSLVLLPFHAPLYWFRPGTIWGRALVGFTLELSLFMFLRNLIKDAVVFIQIIAVASVFVGLIMLVYIYVEWDNLKIKTVIDNIKGKYCTKITWKKN